MKQPALGLVAFTSTLHPTAKCRLQVTELRMDREREQEKERNVKHDVRGEVDEKGVQTAEGKR